jgi:seryl-tRNA synthetase
MGLFSITNKNQRKFLRMIEKDFKKGLLEKDKQKFRKLIDIDPENRKCLSRFKNLDKELRNEGKKNIPNVDVSEEIAERCGILCPKRY